MEEFIEELVVKSSHQARKALAGASFSPFPAMEEAGGSEVGGGGEGGEGGEGE